MIQLLFLCNGLPNKFIFVEEKREVNNFSVLSTVPVCSKKAGIYDPIHLSEIDAGLIIFYKDILAFTFAFVLFHKLYFLALALL